MKKTLTAAVALSLLVIASRSHASVGNGGMAECISMSVETALSVYGQTHSMYPIPNVIVSKSDRSPSNGVDVKVAVNGTVAYYVIASPNGGGPESPFLGCTSARLMLTAPLTH